jgi:hypothetical protein
MGRKSGNSGREELEYLDSGIVEWWGEVLEIGD